MFYSWHFIPISHILGTFPFQANLFINNQLTDTYFHFYSYHNNLYVLNLVYSFFTLPIIVTLINSLAHFYNSKIIFLQWSNRNDFSLLSFGFKLLQSKSVQNFKTISDFAPSSNINVLIYYKLL